MTETKKRALYESIMQEVAVTVKQRLNEAFDYKAENSDGASDRRADYFAECVQLLKDKVKELKQDEKKVKDKSPEWYNHGGWCYTIIGMVNPVIKMMIDSGNDWHIDNELLDILDKAIQETKDDKEFRKGWKNVRDFEKALAGYEKQLKEYRKHIQELHNH